jgi:phosphoglycolate phosphatase
MAVLSNKPDVFTREMIRHFFSADCFANVTGKLEGWPIKPDPALTLEICRQIGADPARSAMVGDSGSDMVTARRAGLLPIGVLWGFRSREELLAGGAAHLATTPADLYNVLTGGDIK